MNKKRISIMAYLGIAILTLVFSIICRFSFNPALIQFSAATTVILAVISAGFDIFFCVKEKDLRHLVTAVLFLGGAIVHSALFIIM